MKKNNRWQFTLFLFVILFVAKNIYAQKISLNKFGVENPILDAAAPVDLPPRDICSIQKCYQVSGTVEGLKDSQLTLFNNGVDPITMTADGTFRFRQNQPVGSVYDITATTVKGTQVCTVSNGAGVLSELNTAKSVSISCQGILAACFSGMKSWLMPSNYNQRIALTYSNFSNYSSQTELSMSEGKTATVVYRNSMTSNFGRSDVDMTSGSVSSVNMTPVGSWHSIAENASGDAILAWTSPWSNAVNIAEKVGGVWKPTWFSQSSGFGFEMEPNVAIDNVGNAIIVFGNSAPASYCSVLHRKNGVWTPNRISPPMNSTCVRPKVAMSKAGNLAMIVFQGVMGANSKVYLSTFDGANWHHPASMSDTFDPAFSADMFAPEVSVSDAGNNAVVVWTANAGTDHYAARYHNGLWFYPASSIFSAASPLSAPTVKVNNLGNAVVVWPTSSNGLWMNEMVMGVWNYGSRISPANTNIAQAQQKSFDIDLNNMGKAIVTWAASYNGGIRNYKSERLHNFAFWTHPSSASDYYGDILPGRGAGMPRVEVDNKCNAILSWINEGSVFDAQYK